MENEHTELIIGYLQGNLSKEETDLFYDWVKESTSNKELFFEIKAMYDAGTSLGEALNIDESWLNLLNKKENSQSRSFRLWYLCCRGLDCGSYQFCILLFFERC